MISDLQDDELEALREQLEGSFQRVAQMQAKRALRRAAEEAVEDECPEIFAVRSEKASCSILR
jgi:hypothetical protein